MTPVELHGRLVARVQQRLDLARAADLSNVDSATCEDPECHRIGHWYTIDDLSRRQDEGGAGLNDFDAAHIAANDPAQVIADCEATRRMLERHAPNEADCCGSCVYRDESSWAWPCPDVLDLASAYATDPDFPEELRRG